MKGPTHPVRLARVGEIPGPGLNDYSSGVFAGEGNTTITNTNCSAISKRCTVTVTVIHFNADGTATIISVSEHQIEYVDAESPSTDP